VSSHEELRAAGVRQSRLCRDNGSPTYAAIIDALVSRLGGDDPAVTLLRNDPRPPVQSALYLRLLGAVHRIALSRPDCPLRRYFPSAGGQVDPQAAVEAFFRVVAAHVAAVAVDMRADVQTNEVGRSAPLSAAMNYPTATAGLPLRLLGVGASAGLNLWMDRYFVQAGAAGWGPPDSPVRLAGHFISGQPPATAMTVVDRRGCVWGASTPSRRLTCDVLSQPILAYRTRAHYHRGPRASPKGTREDYRGSMSSQYKDHACTARILD
jgi:hypothetical protein